MTAAAARAGSSHRNSATRQGLERAVAWSRQWSAEFPFCLANHLPMVLVALHRMGASDERLEAYCHIYHEQNGLVPVPERTDEITRDNWRESLGQREREGDYRAFFAGEVAAARRDAGRPPLPAGADSRHGGERHARVHAHGLCDDDRQRRGNRRRSRLLGRNLSFARRLARTKPSTGDPAEVLAFMSGPTAFRHVEPERDLLWHFMRAVAQKPEFAPVVDMLAIGPETHDRVARCRLRSTPRRSTFARCMR